MSAVKHLLEEVALREFGAVTEGNLKKAIPIAQAELTAELQKRGYPHEALSIIEQARQTAGLTLEPPRPVVAFLLRLGYEVGSLSDIPLRLQEVEAQIKQTHCPHCDRDIEE